ncbi:hypothetical protein PRUPE_3G042800 [Prunus persica]|uniref:KH type-2 domain-containing protein n=1 Tax=Prunus persica TaxID=3760 RepID=A0A251PV18_PRUPE|nr:hypothetical protein PRUPE_3G042800 [Prunus persica]
MATQTSKKRKFVANGVFLAELNEVMTRELAEDGYSGVEVRVTPVRTEIIIRAIQTQNVLGEKGRRIRELTSVVQKRLCAIAQAESLRYKLLGGLAVRRACYGVLRFVMESVAKECEVIVSGKLRAQPLGVLEMKVKIMLDWDPKGKQGPTTPLPDLVTIHQPKEEEDYIRPSVVAAAEIIVLAA